MHLHRFAFHGDDGSFQDLTQLKPLELAPRDVSKLTNRLIQCPICDARISQEREEGAVSVIERTENGTVRSVLFKNTPYHRHDTVLYYDDEDSADGTAKPRQLKVGIVEGWLLDERRGTSNICKIKKLGFRDDLVRNEALATTILPVATALPLDEVR